MAMLRYADPVEVGMSTERVQRVGRLAAGWVASGVTPSLVVLLARRGGVVLHDAFGQHGPDAESPPLRADALFPLASITKPITATLVMCLVEDGLLGLNRQVQEYLPEFVGDGKDLVMVHHLLTHSSGLRDEDVDRFAAETRGRTSVPPAPPDQPAAAQERLVRGYGTPLWKSPGVEMSYCSFGYMLLGEIVRRLSGASIGEFARERLFGPAGMDDSYFEVPPVLEERIVQRPPTAPNPQFNRPADRLASWAQGGVYGTALDLARFGQVFLDGGLAPGGRVLSRVSIAQMTRDQIPGLGLEFIGRVFPEAGYGYGWKTEATPWPGFGMLQSKRTFSHAGAGGVFTWVDPERELVGVYLSVWPREIEGWPPPWGVDRFMDAATASVVD